LFKPRFDFPRSMAAVSITSVIDEYIVGTLSPSDTVAVLKSIALNDPGLCVELTEALKRKMCTHLDREQVAAVDLLDKLVDEFDMTLHQIVHEKSFLSFLEKYVGDEKLGDRVKSLLTKWSTKFAKDEDIFPNFQIFFSRLVEQGLVVPLSNDRAQVMDEYLINEAEGQDPEEFKCEVKETLVLFNDVFNAIVNVSRMSKEDSISRRDALISIASNLDRYSEQFGLWIEQLEPGEYMVEAIGLNDQVTDALSRYKKLRTGEIKSAPVDGESDDSSSDSSDD
jgi:hypothetical protein